MHESRTANLLGAAALAIGDRLLRQAAAAADTSTSGAAALITLANSPGLGVTELGARIGLSQPAAARMIDGLSAAGLVERRPGSNGRSVAIWPTRRGRTAAHRALRAREEQLAQAVDRLAPDEQAALMRALENMLYGLFDRPGSQHVLCRMCDRGACQGGGLPCPVGQASRDREAGDG